MGSFTLTLAFFHNDLTRHSEQSAGLVHIRKVLLLWIFCQICPSLSMQLRSNQRVVVLGQLFEAATKR